MRLDEARRVHRLLLPHPRHQRVDRAEGDHRHPAERAGMDVADGPVGVVRERVDRADRHERALEGREAVEHRRHHHEAQRGVVAHLVPGAVQRRQRVAGGGPGRHQEHDREGHAQRLHPLRQRRVVQVVRARPHVEEGNAPEGDDRQPVGEDRPSRPLGQVIVHHAEEAGGQEEGHRVVAVPPFRHRVLHAGEQGIALGVAEGDRHGEVVDDVQHRHDQDEGHVVPVRHVDVRFLAPGERAQVDEEIDHPDDDEPDVGIPFRLGIFLGLGDAQQVAAGGDDAEQVVADQHEPGRELVGQARARRALQHMEGRGDQRVAAEAEDDAGGVHRPDAPEARPGLVHEGQLRPGQQRGDPDAEEHADDGPGHRQNDADLGRVVVVGGQPAVVRLRRVVSRHHVEADADAEHEHDEALGSHRIAAPSGGHRQAQQAQNKQYAQRRLAFAQGEARDHAYPPSPDR